jgi:thioredoxin-like negative regulator of GroEL
MKTLMAIAMALALTTSMSQAQEAFSQPAVSGSGIAKFLTYKQAYKKAQTGDKPLLILVTADWCAPCRQMKATTIPELLSRGALSKYHFAMVDYDKEKEIADELMKGGEVRLPHLVLFEKTKDGKWLRRREKGYQTAQKVEKFAAQANSVRLASSTQENTEKK